MSQGYCYPMAAIRPQARPNDPYASLRDYLYYWRFQEANATDNAIDQAGVNTLTQFNSPSVLGFGRRCRATLGDQYFQGAINTDLRMDFTLATWFYAQTLLAYNVVFSNRAATGQMTMIADGAGNLQIYVMDPAQSGPYAAIAQGVAATYHLILIRYTHATKTFAVSMNNGATTNSGAYPGTLTASSGPMQFGRDTALGGLTTDARYRATGLWTRHLTAGEETQLYNAGSTFSL